MSVEIKQVYEFGPYRLDTARALLLREGQVVPIAHKALETLALLVRNSGRVVSKEELMREVWPDAFVEEGSLARNISVLRKALGESPAEHQYIETIPRRGYRFVATVSESFPITDFEEPEATAPGPAVIPIIESAPAIEPAQDIEAGKTASSPAVLPQAGKSDWRKKAR